MLEAVEAGDVDVVVATMTPFQSRIPRFAVSPRIQIGHRITVGLFTEH